MGIYRHVYNTYTHTHSAKAKVTLQGSSAKEKTQL